MKRIAYIILNYKTYLDTKKVTEEILSFGKEDDVIIIVDNCSPNESSSELHKSFDNNPQVDVIDSDENGGYAKGNNLGLRFAKKYNPKYVCIINNDVHFTSDVIDSLCDWYGRLPNVAMISPIQMLPNGKPAQFNSLALPTIGADMASYIPGLFKLIYSKRMFNAEENTLIHGVCKVGLIPGAFAFIDYNLMGNLGFYDEETFLFCEERFFAKKAKLAGYDNYIILEETYLHQHSLTIGKEATKRRQKYMIFKERCNYYRKYSKHHSLYITMLSLSYWIGNAISYITTSIKRCQHQN